MIFKRIVAIFLMFLGAIFYSFIVGSLSSVILSSDSRQRLLETKLNTLIELRQKHSLDNAMFNKIKRALKYGYSRFFKANRKNVNFYRHDQDNLHFLNELPLQLRTKVKLSLLKSFSRTK